MRPRPLKMVAKTGYAARGVVYFIVGGFALLAAVGPGGDTTNARGALLKLLETGVGSLLLTAVALGLLCYATWRVFESVLDLDRHGTDVKGLTVRGGLLVSAVVNGTLGAWALTVALGQVAGDSGDGGAVAWLMRQPYGHWLVGAVGVFIIGAGAAHIFKGATRGYEKWFVATEREMKLIRPVSTTGLIARGIVFLIIGGLFIYAGLTVDPDKAGGMREALQWLRGMPFGAALFLIMAVGLVCFGAYSMIEAIYRRINALESQPLEARRPA